MGIFDGKSTKMRSIENILSNQTILKALLRIRLWSPSSFGPSSMSLNFESLSHIGYAIPTYNLGIAMSGSLIHLHISPPLNIEPGAFETIIFSFKFGCANKKSCSYLEA